MFHPIENKMENIKSIWPVFPKTGMRYLGSGRESIIFTGFTAIITVKTEIKEK